MKKEIADLVAASGLKISKVVEIRLSKKTFIYFDKMKDGTWRLSYTVQPIDETP